MPTPQELTQYDEVCRPLFEALFERTASKEDQARIMKLVEQLATKLESIDNKLFRDNGQASYSSRLRAVEEFIAARKKEQEENAKSHREIMTAIIVKVIFWAGSVISAALAGMYVVKH